MLFRRDSHAGIMDGSITLTFRRWKRAQARPGGRHRLNRDGVVVIESDDQVLAASITSRDATRAGFASLRDLRVMLAAADDEPVYRIAFHFEREADPRATLARDDAISPDDLAAIVARLDRMDRASADGAWTRETLQLIGERPRGGVGAGGEAGP